MIRSLRRDPLLHTQCRTPDDDPCGFGRSPPLTWVLEVDDVARFHSAIASCQLLYFQCGAERSSAETIKRMPISKQRNKHLQSVLIEAAKLAPRLSPELALVYDTGKQKGRMPNRASIAVARKHVALICLRWTAVDERVRSGRRTKSSGLKPLRRTSRFDRTRPARSRRSRLGDGVRSQCLLRNVSRLAGNTHSIFCDGLNSPIQRMDVWFCVTRRNRAQRHNREVMNTLSETTRRSPERYGMTCPT